MCAEAEEKVSTAAVNPSGDAINDRVPKVKGFKYAPDQQTTFIFLDELADEVHQQKIYIARLENDKDKLANLVDTLVDVCRNQQQELDEYRERIYQLEIA